MEVLQWCVRPAGFGVDTFLLDLLNVNIADGTYIYILISVGQVCHGATCSQHCGDRNHQKP